jgi:hypothetical protein
MISRGLLLTSLLIARIGRGNDKLSLKTAFGFVFWFWRVS